MFLREKRQNEREEEEDTPTDIISVQFQDQKPELSVIPSLYTVCAFFRGSCTDK